MRTFGWSPSDLELQVKNIFSPFLTGEEKHLNLVFQELIGEIDQDGNGSISFNEFVWLMTRWTVFRKLTRLKISSFFSGKSKTQRSRTRSGRRSGFSTRRVMGSFAPQVIWIDIFFIFMWKLNLQMAKQDFFVSLGNVLWYRLWEGYFACHPSICAIGLLKSKKGISYGWILRPTNQSNGVIVAELAHVMQSLGDKLSCDETKVLPLMLLNLLKYQIYIKSISNILCRKKLSCDDEKRQNPQIILWKTF